MARKLELAEAGWTQACRRIGALTRRAQAYRGARPLAALAARLPLVRVAVLAAPIAFASWAFWPAAVTAEPSPRGATLAASDSSSRFIALGLGKSVVVDLPRDAKDVLVANPQIANAVVRSARRAYLIGVAIGQTNVYFFDAQGRQIAGFDIAVTRDLNGVRAALKKLMPQEDVRIEGVNDGVMLTGTVANAAESQQAFDIATRLVGENKVANGLVIRDREQVMLKVTVAEVDRQIIKQLGINLNGSMNFGTTTLDFNTVNPFSANNTSPSTFVSPQGALTGPQLFGPIPPNPVSGVLNNRIGATLRAMDQAGIVRTLAEPNLTAISGETANFIAGGEFPVPAGYTCDPVSRLCQYSVSYKKFGVGLNFTPVVLSEGRISLKVATEVSELSQEGALVLPSLGQQTVTIPSIKARRSETTVELPSGGSLAMAGMIQEQTKQAINGFPGLLQLPILGTLFKSRDYFNRQTELMILVTPYIVRAVAQKDLARPDDGYVDASDPASILLGRFNRIYGAAGKEEPRPAAYHGNYGFILD